jgi:hypothetical protein
VTRTHSSFVIRHSSFRLAGEHGVRDRHTGHEACECRDPNNWYVQLRDMGKNFAHSKLIGQVSVSFNKIPGLSRYGKLSM